MHDSGEKSTLAAPLSHSERSPLLRATVSNFNWEHIQWWTHATLNTINAEYNQ